MATPVAQAPLPSLMREAGRGGSRQWRGTRTGEAGEGERQEKGRDKIRGEAVGGERQEEGRGSRRGEAGGGERQ